MSLPEMNSVVCTLYEGDYHYGLGALANSLYKTGFRGLICVGYRETLPPWVINGKETGKYTDFTPADGLTLRFIPLETKLHFANYKPDFIIDVLENYAAQATAIFYFDPDIVVNAKWSFFDNWAESGVALCEDVNSPIPESHPLRIGWGKFFASKGLIAKARNSIYVNSGFIGVHKQHVEFVKTWQAVQQIVNAETNGGNPWQNWETKDRTDLFFRPDQDALNITIAASIEPVSLVGKEGMQFISGWSLMCHAIGPLKPWHRNFIWKALCGIPPTDSDYAFWRSTLSPIAIHKPFEVATKKFHLKIAAAIGRFIRKAGL